MVNSFGPIMDARDSILDGHVKMHLKKLDSALALRSTLFCFAED
mgnify:CR=1 FL=1|jgi:hypothetical protein